jgi:hypothetical protein
MSDTVRNEIPLIITALVTAVMLIAYFINIPFVKSIFNTINSITIPITAMFLVYGALTSLVYNANSVIKKRPNWQYQAIMIVFTLAYLLYGIIFGLNDPTYISLYNSIIANGQTIIFAILAFWFIESAFYSFRISSIEMAFFTITALIVMSGNTPAISAIWKNASPTVQWFLTKPMSSAYRGIIIAVAISITLMAIRIILRKERGWMGGSQQ